MDGVRVPDAPRMNEPPVTVDIQWFGVTNVESLTWHDQPLLKHFNVRSHRGLMAEFDVRTQHQIVPHSLTPTDWLHRILSRTIDGDSEVRRLPYLIENYVEHYPLRIVSIAGELFPGNILIVKVKGRLELPEVGGWFGRIYPHLRELRTPRSTSIVDSLIRQFIAAASGERDLSAKRVSYRDYFVMQVSSQPLFKAEPSESLYRDFAALLTDAVKPQELGKSVVDFITDENRTLNEKAESEVLLVNRQGCVYYLPVEPYESPNRHRFKKVSSLSMIALFARQFLGDDAEFRGRHPTMATFIADRLRRFVDMPELIFASSFANHHTWERLSDSLKLKLLMEEWESRSSEQELNHTSKFGVVPERWWDVREFEIEIETGS